MSTLNAKNVKIIIGGDEKMQAFSEFLWLVFSVGKNQMLVIVMGLFLVCFSTSCYKQYSIASEQLHK